MFQHIGSSRILYKHGFFNVQHPVMVLQSLLFTGSVRIIVSDALNSFSKVNTLLCSLPKQTDTRGPLLHCQTLMCHYALVGVP